MTQHASLAAVLEERARQRPTAVAIREKRFGLWRETTWAEYAAAVREVALGLDEAGVAAGDRVAIFADNDPGWLYADLAIQALGAASVGIYAGQDPEEVGACLDAAEARIVLCGDQEQVDALRQTTGTRAVVVERVVVSDTTGLHTEEYADAPLETLAELRERGRQRDGGAARYAELLAARRPDEVATVAFTSGTTGLPSGVLLSHGGQLALARMVCDRLGLRARDRSFSLLPLAHAGARLFDAYAPLVAGSSVHFAESHDTTPADLAATSPTILLGSPRLLERIKGDVEVRIERAGRFKRAAYRWALRTMTASTKRRLSGERDSGLGAILGRAVVGRFVVRQAGLADLRYGGIAGSFVASELSTWFWALGVPIREQYGQVETGGVVSSQRGLADAGTAGPPLDPAIEIRLDDGELLVRSPGLLVGRLGEPLALEDGWYRTGDLAQLDDEGRIVPVGRRAHVLRTAAGDEISPAEIESTLKVSPYIASAMVVAAGRPFVTAVVELQQESVSDWARRQGIPVTTYASLVTSVAVGELIGRAVDDANRELGAASTIRAFRILPRPLERELTPTGKIRRSVVEAEHAAVIESMYEGSTDATPAPV